MTSTNRIRRIALCLILIFTVSVITFANATTENNYYNDTNLLPNIFESAHTENGYKANLVVNPHVTGVYAAENGYKLDLTINPSQIGGSLTENNYELDLIPENTFADPSDVAVTEILCSKTIVGQGYSMQINTTLANQALKYETFYVTISANTTTLNTQTVTLVGSTFKTLTLTWNATDFAKGNYTISTYALPAPSETDTADNNYTCIVPVHIGVPGDVSGTIPGVYDGITNMKDIAYLVSLFNSKPSWPNWMPNADVNNDAVVNMKDIAIAVYYFNQHE